MKAVSQSPDGAETILPDVANSFFRDCLNDAHDCPEQLKSLAMLHLHEVCDWTQEELSKLFGKSCSAICRNLQKTRTSLRAAGEIETRIDIERTRETLPQSIN